MTSRERVLTALEHREPDRVPIDLGGTVVSSIAVSTYEKLREYLKLPKKDARIMELVQQIAFVDEDVMRELGIDIIPIFANPPSIYTPVFLDEGEKGISFKDEFGATLRKPKGGFYFDWQEFPLSEPSIDLLEKMPWPDPLDPARYRGLREYAKRVRETTEYALFGMAPCGHDLLNQLFRVRGMENGLIDLIQNIDFAEAFLDRMTETIIKAQIAFLDEVGELMDIHFAADDLAGQNGPLISPKTFRELIKPRWGRIIATIKSKTKAKVFFHSDGAIEEFIPDLIEIGIDIINPVQVSAKGMDPAKLKKKYGKNISFWGGGCDTQRVLPYGTPAQVQEEVKRRIKELAPGGGFVFSAVHNIQPFVPIENILEMFRSAKQFGVYPIRLD